MDRELLLEIGVEEMPASWLPSLNAQLASRLAARLAEQGLATPRATVEAHSTPRRLTACLSELVDRQEDKDETVMFFGEGRIAIVQRMILADNEADRRAALNDLLPLQRSDFYGVFKAMRGLPVTIRTIDPPLHEFLPKREELMVDIARMEATGRTGQELEEKRALLKRVEQLHVFLWGSCVSPGFSELAPTPL